MPMREARVIALAAKCASTRMRPASPSRRRTSSSPSSRSSARASAGGSRGGTSRPVSPSTTASGVPPTAVATTGFACAIYFRRVLFRSAKNFVLMGVAPTLGGLMLTWVFIQSVINLSNPKEAYSGSVFGIGTPLFIGIVALLLGVVLMAWSWYANPDFFRNPLSATPVQAPGTEEPGERG